jgi:hypothetical protein
VLNATFNYISVMVTGAWIVTGGTNTGVMKHVGEAVRDYGLTTTTGAPVVAIGVATWGCIHKKKELVSPVRVFSVVIHKHLTAPLLLSCHGSYFQQTNQ